MKKVKLLLSVICFCILFSTVNNMLKYLIVDDTTTPSRITMYELYGQNTNIDVLFVGSSHCFRSLVPDVTDAIFQKNTFNAGTGYQALDGSLAIIKEASQYYDLEQVYVELFYGMAPTSTYKERTFMTPTYMISDYMKPSFRKVKYLLNASSKEYYTNSFLVVRRDWQNIFDADYVLELLSKKNTSTYKNYQYEYVTNEVEAYLGKGYIANYSVINNGVFWNETDFPPLYPENVSEDWIQSLREIMIYCNEKNIQLTLISAPMPMFSLVDRGNYDDYINFIRQIASEHNVSYYDFNLCREAYWSDDPQYFSDWNHLNHSGAVCFSTLFSQFFTGQISEKELFYDSFADKIDKMQSSVFGLIIKEEMGNSSIIIKPVTNASFENLLYDIKTKQDDKEESIMIQDVKPLTEISYDPSTAGSMEITVFLQEKEVCNVEVSYGGEK